MALKPSDLRAGNTIYRVYALKQDSFILPVVLQSRPFLTDIGMRVLGQAWADAGYDRLQYYDNHFYLEDAGILPNNYNQHRAFKSRRKAASYLKQCLRLDRGRDTSEDSYEYAHGYFD